MASKFAITAELNLQTKNLSQVVNNLKQQFQGIDLNIKIKDLASAESQVRGIGKAADGASKSIGSLGSSIADAAKRFSAITLATGTFVGLTRAIKNAVGDAIEFEREMVKIAQATGKTVSQLRGLEVEVGNIATGLGASSKELINAARTLTQAGFAADKVTGSLKVLAQTDLAATFKSIEDTTEGAIAILNQFGREAQRTGTEVAFLERSLSAINQVSKDFAVESSDLITAVKTTGSAFESAGGSLNELIALFTSVRSTTRESAESIATGFRTIFTRVQRVDTLNNLRDLGIELQDMKGQFVGPMEAAKRLSIALSTIDPKDFRFNLIVEQLGGFRQVSKVIPLIQQFAVAQKALGVAQNSSGSLAKDAATAQQSLAVQIQRTREEFLRFIKELTQSTAFQSTVSSLLQMANAFIKVADTLKPMIPLIASFGALKLGQSLLPSVKSFTGNKKAQGGKIHAFASGGLVPGSGNGDTVPAMLSPGEFVIKKSSVKKLGIANLAKANKYANGGKLQKEDTIGAAILKGNRGQAKEDDVIDADVEKPDGTRFKKQYKLIKQPLSQKNTKFFKAAIEQGLLKGLRTGVKQLNEKIGLGVNLPLPEGEEANFLLGLNDASYGNAFENILSATEGSGKFDPNQDPQRPFDFVNGLGNAQKLFDKLGMNYVDAKASFGVASNANMVKKLNNQLEYEFKDKSAAPKKLTTEQKKANLGKSQVKEMQAAENVAKTQLAAADLETQGKQRLVAFLQSSGLASKKIKGVSNKVLGTGKRPFASLSTALEKRPYADFANMSEAEMREVISSIVEPDEVQARAIGGLIHHLAKGGGNLGTDTVPAMLTPGEFVINKKSAEKIGGSALNRMNKVGKFANGGLVQKFAEGGKPTLSQVKGGHLKDLYDSKSKKNLKKLGMLPIDYAENNTDSTDKNFNHLNKKDVAALASYVHGSGVRVDNKLQMDRTSIPSSLTNQFLETSSQGGDMDKFWGNVDAFKDDKDRIKKQLPEDIASLDKATNKKVYMPEMLYSGVHGNRFGNILTQLVGQNGLEQIKWNSKNNKFLTKNIEEILPFLSGSTVGKEFTIPSFLSTSRDKRVANGFASDPTSGAVLNITPKRSKIGRGKAAFFAGKEKEMLLPRSNRFKVNQASLDGGQLEFNVQQLAKGGLGSGTDTVPAMLTPGEYVINKKSAQAIGYGKLGQMNKVGKFASGGPVQHFAAGGPTLDPATLKMLVEIRKMNTQAGAQGPTTSGGALGSGNKQIQTFLKMVDALNKAGIDSSKLIKEGFAEIKKDAANFKISKTLKATYQEAKGSGGPSALTTQADKLKSELDGITNKGNALSSGLVILASTVAGVVSQMSGLDKEYADMITAFSGTFSVINGIGQNLKNMGAAQLAEMISTKKHEMAVKADEAALVKHAGAASSAGTPKAGKEGITKFFEHGFKGAEGAIVGFAAASAVYAAQIASTNAQAEKAGEALGKAMEKFAASANNEAEVRSGMIKTLMLSEKAQSDYRASTSKEAMGGAAVGGVAGSIIGSFFGPIGTMIGGAAGSAIGMIIGTEFAKDFDGSKVTAAATGISNAFTTSAKGILDANKFFEKIDSKDLNDVNQQFSKMSSELAKAQGELSGFDPKILDTGSETLKANFNKAADSVRNFENSLSRLAGVKLQKLTTVMSDMAKLGQNFDIGPAIKAQQEEITKILNAKYNPDIARATKAGKGELAKGLTTQRDQEIAQSTREFEKSLLEARLQILQTEKALIQERNARDAVIGTLIQEKALKTTLQNFKFGIQQAAKSVDQLDAAFGNSVSGLKSAIPSGDVFDLEMPDAADLEPALAALRTIGPIGEKLATNLTDLNTVIPNLETGLESLAKAQATGGASTDIDKLIGDTVEKGFGVSLGSAVGKRLSEIIKDRMTGKGGNVENANPSILSANTREAITKEFTDYAQAIKSMSKETLQAWAAAEEEQRRILDKINESENRKLELTNQGVDSYGRMVEAVSKAYGKNVPLAVKNMQRFAKQFNSIGKTAYTSVQSIGKNLKQAKGQLAQGVKDPLEAGKLQNTANRLEQSLKTLANQSDRAGDTLAELEKFKAQREAITNAGASYAFGSDEQRKSKDDATVALQQVMAAGGDLDAVSSDMRGQIDSLLGELGDAGKSIKKQLTANFFAKRGNMDMANMVMSETSGPEQKLIAELQNIYQEEIAAQKELKDLEIMHGQGMITGLDQVTNQIAGFNDQLASKVKKGEKGAQDVQKAAGVTDSKMTVKEIDGIIASTKTSLTNVEENIKTFAKYLGELNDYLAFVKDPEAFKKTGAPIPAKPGAAPVAKAKAKGGIIYKADGGFTPRGTDTVPAMLTPGEFVIRKSAVDSIGVDNLEAMNNGYASGGLVSYFRRGGRAMNYGRSANNKRQKAIARRDERRARRLESEAQAREQGQFFNVADSQQQQTNMATASGSVNQLVGNTSASSQGYGLKPGANPADYIQKPAIPAAPAAPFQMPGTTGPLTPPTYTPPTENQKQIDIAANLTKASAAAAVKEIQAGPEGANTPQFEDSTATRMGKWFNRNIYDRNRMTGSVGGSIASLAGYDAGGALQVRAGSSKDIHRQNVLDKYDIQERNLPEEHRQKEKGPGQFATSVAKKGLWGTLWADEQRTASPQEIAANKKKKEEAAKAATAKPNRQISDLSKDEARNMLGRLTGMANGGMVEYHARGGRAGARARAAQRRQNRMQAEQEFPSMAQVGPQNVHRDLAGTPVTRSVMDNPQNFAQASNARSRKAAMRGVPGYLGEMAGMGQMIHVGADSEESKARTKHSTSGANQFAQGEERQAMLKDIADARQRDKDKYSPERMKSLYGEKNATPAANYKRPPGKGWNWDPTAKKFVNENPQPPAASSMGATAPPKPQPTKPVVDPNAPKKPKAIQDPYNPHRMTWDDTGKQLTAYEKAMQSSKPGYRENTEPLVDYTNPYHAQVAHAKEAKAQGKPAPPTAAEIHAKTLSDNAKAAQKNTTIAHNYQAAVDNSKKFKPSGNQGTGSLLGAAINGQKKPMPTLPVPPMPAVTRKYKDSPEFKLIGEKLKASDAKRKAGTPQVAKLAQGGRVGGYSGGGKIRRYQDGGNVDPYAESGGGGGSEAPQMPDMSGFSKSIESLTAFVGSFDGFSKTMAGLASQLSSVTVTHNVTFGGQVNVGGVSGEGIVNAMKSTIEGWVKDQISKHPDVQKSVKASDQTRKG